LRWGEGGEGEGMKIEKEMARLERQTVDRKNRWYGL
jgi:hypothetical protein